MYVVCGLGCAMAEIASAANVFAMIVRAIAKDKKEKKKMKSQEQHHAGVPFRAECDDSVDENSVLETQKGNKGKRSRNGVSSFRSDPPPTCAGGRKNDPQNNRFVRHGRPPTTFSIYYG